MIDTGSGPPIVIVPGIQGRWEWIEPAVRALAERCRVLALSLPGEPGSGMAIPDGSRFEVFARQIDGVLDDRGIDSAAICGVSFGGLVAAHYAATRADRVASLVLVSAVGPRWQPDARVERFIRSPHRLAPLFVATSPGRLYPEVRAALPRLGARLRFGVQHGARVARAPFSAARMGQRLRLAGEVDFVEICRRIAAPTLVVTGEPALDRVVPVAGTLEYVDLVRGASSTVLGRTGHIGLVTRPDAFARVVGEFVVAHSGGAAGRSHGDRRSA